ncbi:MAG: guanosine monophosphate reductase [Patescibacteria group bacterium]
MNQKIEVGLSYDDVLLVPGYSEVDSRQDVNLTTYLTPRLTLKLPLISANMTDVTGVEMAVTLGKLGALGVLPRFMSAEDEADMVAKVKKEGVIVAAAVGLRNGMFARAENLVKAGAEILFLDVAHGHMRQAIEATRNLRQKFGKFVDIVSGNVATYEGASDLFKAGADCVKVGVGPGSICITRIETGFGVPQLTAVMEGVKAARRHKKTIIADGGTKNSGDVVKALAAGAAAVMAGSQFAGTEEAPGQKVEIKGKVYKKYYASTSFLEKKNHLKKNGEELPENYVKHIEGVESVTPYKGAVKEVIERMAANIRSGFSYCGAHNIQELWEKARFIRITPQGLKESGAHDVFVKEDGWHKK